MKKLILMALLCCFAAAPVALAQNNVNDPAAQAVRQSQMKREKNYNENKQALTDGKKAADQSVKSMEKQQKALKEEQQQAKAAADAAKEQKKAYEEQEKKAKEAKKAAEKQEKKRSYLSCYSPSSL